MGTRSRSHKIESTRMSTLLKFCLVAFLGKVVFWWISSRQFGTRVVVSSDITIALVFGLVTILMTICGLVITYLQLRTMRREGKRKTKLQGRATELPQWHIHVKHKSSSDLRKPPLGRSRRSGSARVVMRESRDEKQLGRVERNI
ncbi:hypothetical protein BDZ45DRAFT_52682 [Acephala macrosclerotiorum]|nr:hypothetical protein BDZ45DRAFT_52682 [Acephala macrosclerotiorum]